MRKRTKYQKEKLLEMERFWKGKSKCERYWKVEFNQVDKQDRTLKVYWWPWINERICKQNAAFCALFDWCQEQAFEIRFDGTRYKGICGRNGKFYGRQLQQKLLVISIPEQPNG
jgi:hypothetical protein